MQKYSDVVATTNGTQLEVLSSATVTVYLAGTTTLASIFSQNNAAPQANPFTSSITGRIEFYAADGRYDIRVEKAGFSPVVVADVLLEDPDGIDDDLDGITISNSTLTGCSLEGSVIEEVASVEFDTTTPGAGGVGVMKWNPDEETLDLGLDANVTLQVGQETVYHVDNNTGSAIPNGAAVRAAGTSGNSGKILIALAQANGAQPAKTFMGIATESIGTGTAGFVTHFGKVRGIQTNGANYGETWADGDILYVSQTTPGALTNVQPTANGGDVITAAIVIRAHPSNGTLFVRPTFDSHGADVVRYLPSGTGAVATNVQSKLREFVSVKDFGAVGNWNGVTGADDTAAFQAAFDACSPGGEVLIPTANGERYRLTDEIRITKPVMIRGSSAGNVYGDYTASSADTFTGVQQTNTAKAAFKLVASLENYAFNAYGILEVHFKDLMISGPGISSFAVAGVCTDTTINGGDYHIRHCHMDNVAIRFFTTGVDYTGINYLNTFVNCLAYNCDTGWKLARGASSDNGGQTRWFGCAGISCGTVASLNEDGSAGSYAFFGCTLSESQYGIRCDEEALLTVSGCELESLTNSGNGAGIYINIAEANPNSSGAKTIVGNKFLSSDADIWIDKTTSAFSGGGFYWPMLIDGNYFGSANGLKITVPGGHTGIDSKAFVFGPSNSGLLNSQVDPSQISANFLGYDARTWAAKAAPSGVVVGTSDTQTLSNKSFTQNALTQTGTAFQDVTYTISTASGTTGNFARLRFAENASGTVLGALTAHGSAYGGSPSRNYVVTLNTQGVDRFWFSSTEFRTTTDNAYTLGSASARWSVVYAATGTINTSDARTKDQIFDLTDAEHRVAVRIKGLLKTFKFKDAVQAKGDDARIHVGVIAQDVASAFQAEGLDPARYALFCHDTWEDQYEPVFEDREVTDEETGVVRLEQHKVGERLLLPAGDRYGIRYEELLAFIVAAL